MKIAYLLTLVAALSFAGCKPADSTPTAPSTNAAPAAPAAPAK